MIVNTPDGPVNFPDSMSSDDIQGVLRQKYGFNGGAQSARRARRAPGRRRQPAARTTPRRRSISRTASAR
jgi:hypothetical protein